MGEYPECESVKMQFVKMHKKESKKVVNFVQKSFAKSIAIQKNICYNLKCKMN